MLAKVVAIYGLCQWVKGVVGPPLHPGFDIHRIIFFFFRKPGHPHISLSLPSFFNNDGCGGKKRHLGFLEKLAATDGGNGHRPETPRHAYQDKCLLENTLPVG